MTDIVERLPLVCEAITEEYGEECAMFDPECWTCKVWAELRRSLSEARATGRREGMEEAWSMCERFIAGQKEFQTKATEKRKRKEARDHETMKFAGVQLSAAIRAAMEKAE